MHEVADFVQFAVGGVEKVDFSFNSGRFLSLGGDSPVLAGDFLNVNDVVEEEQRTLETPTRHDSSASPDPKDNQATAVFVNAFVEEEQRTFETPPHHVSSDSPDRKDNIVSCPRHLKIRPTTIPWKIL